MKAKYVTKVTVIDPDSKLPVEVMLYKEDAGGMFGIDASYITSEEPENVPSVFENGRVHLIGD